MEVFESFQNNVGFCGVKLKKPKLYVGGIVGYDTAGEYLNTYSIITINNKVDCIAHYCSEYSSSYSKVFSSSYLGEIVGYSELSRVLDIISKSFNDVNRKTIKNTKKLKDVNPIVDSIQQGSILN